jgi:hypothetical protein
VVLELERADYRQARAPEMQDPAVKQRQVVRAAVVADNVVNVLP